MPVDYSPDLQPIKNRKYFGTGSGDHGAKETYRYTIKPDGTLVDKTLFVASGSDGIKLDSEGNVYLTTDAIVIYNCAGEQIARIETPLTPANLCFAGPDYKLLFITARTHIYCIKLNVSGLR